MKFYSVGSSSKANCTYISAGSDAILVDAGFSYKKTMESLALAGMNREAIKAIFITHEHADHVGGLKRIAKALKVPIYASRGTLQAILQKGLVADGISLHEINQQCAQIGSMTISPFHVPHDCADGLGFVVSEHNRHAAICTDLGEVPAEVKKLLEGVDFVLLESNYDPSMLQAGNYPYLLKQRILSNLGHLSNDDCATLIDHLVQHGVQRFLLGHLSPNNNFPELALANVSSVLSQRNLKLGEDYQAEIAPAYNSNKVYTI